jgi:hypothetical protein
MSLIYSYARGYTTVGSKHTVFVFICCSDLVETCVTYSVNILKGNCHVTYIRISILPSLLFIHFTEIIRDYNTKCFL